MDVSFSPISTKTATARWRALRFTSCLGYATISWVSRARCRQRPRRKSSRTPRGAAFLQTQTAIVGHPHLRPCVRESFVGKAPRRHLHPAPRAVAIDLRSVRPRPRLSRHERQRRREAPDRESRREVSCPQLVRRSAVGSDELGVEAVEEPPSRLGRGMDERGRRLLDPLRTGVGILGQDRLPAERLGSRSLPRRGVVLDGLHQPGHPLPVSFRRQVLPAGELRKLDRLQRGELQRVVLLPLLGRSAGDVLLGAIEPIAGEGLGLVPQQLPDRVNAAGPLLARIGARRSARIRPRNVPWHSRAFPRPPARELPAPGSGGGGANAGRGFR
jgi:hypothetical protein